jgi:o-succinylbenzoate synthase
MTIKFFELFQFQIPLKTKITIANKEILTREGLILKLYDDENNIGLGEISPLPGLHKESLTQAIEQLRKISHLFIEKEILKNPQELIGQFDQWLNKYNLYPSVQFGFESALISLLAAEQGKSIIEFFDSSPTNPIGINALLSGTTEQILEKIYHYIKDGFTVFKLKVGRNTIEEDIKLVNIISSQIEDYSLLRLDANQAWSFKEALYFLQNINHKNIEYLEEPLIKYDELQLLFDKTNIPIALDENILQIFAPTFDHLSWLKAIIIKPTVIGRIEKTIQLIKYAEENRIKPVISDTFQSGVGISFLFAVSTTIKKKNIAMGFDTYSWLKDDILNQRLNFDGSIIKTKNIQEIINRLDYSKLRKI